MDNQKPQAAMSMLDLLSLINDYVKTIDDLKGQVKAQRQMVTDALEGDKEYYDKSEEVKKINKEKNAIKQKIMKQPAVETAVAKMKGLQTELHDIDDKLSGYLQEYQRVSGTNVIEGVDGEMRQIVPVYRLVKKSKYNP